MRGKNIYGNTNGKINRNQYKTKKRFFWRAFFVLALFFCLQWVQGSLTAEAATEHDHDISTGTLEISDSDTYNVTGITDKYYIIVKKGDPTIKISDLHIDLCDEEDDGSSIESSAICISEGCNVTLFVKGDKNWLRGGNYTSIWTENWGYAGINIESGASLTIRGDQGAVLTVYGGGDYSGAKEGGGGIGSDANNDMGSLLIDGNMTINAYGAEKAAGIGSGSGEDVDGTIKIASGTVNAYGGDQGAGLGSGREGYLNAVEISGGTVYAKGGQWAAGIGGGNAVNQGDGGDVGSIKISGGTITAEGGGKVGEGGAGVGGSDGGEVGTLRIEEGDMGGLSIDARGGKWGAGIGSASDGSPSHNIPSIYIKLNGGTITATGGSQGAGIGGGNTSADQIEIYGKGTINATGVDQSCAIGAGECEDGGDIIIKGDYGASDRSQYADEAARALTIHATTAGLPGAAAIGAADAAGGDITITNANITLTDSNSYSTRTTSAGIGNAVNHQMLSHSLGDITIDNCKITDNNGVNRNGSSIGAGHDSDIGSITIKNSWFQGGNIGSAYNGNDTFRETCVDGITIENSVIVAENTSDTQKAAIGSGSYASVREITIKDSEVTATTNSGAGIGSGGYRSDNEGDPFKWTGCECGNITITGGIVKATGADGGAGIGGGWGTSVGDVTIEKSDVTAESINPRSEEQSGAGIGGGYAESAGTIEIKGSNVTATGGPYSAGIGSSGIDTAATFVWNTTCHTIRIKEGSTVTATGGTEAAGIGTGCGAQFGYGSEILVDDSTVTATGGTHGAGIGAGSNAWADIGGEACDIHLSGTSKITATGGEGAAGIGGGYDGGADNIYITLDDTEYLGDGADGTGGSDGAGDADAPKWEYYVIATGGEGAAGIGSGGVYQKEGGLTQNGHDVHKVDVSGGYVSATGGADAGQGSGAGIGGGAHGGKLKELVVTGGFIDAHAGSANTSGQAANDIGGGGEDVKLEQDGEASISGGTVLGGLSDEFDIIIHGGSVRHITGDAVRLDEKTRVYRNQMQTGEQYLELQDMETCLDDYGTNDVFADENGKVYPYLPVSGTDASTISYAYGGKNRNYYGTTTTSTDGGANWLKMESAISFLPLEKEPLVGEAFILKLEDNGLPDGSTPDSKLPDGTAVTFTVENGDVAIIDAGTNKILPDAQVQLRANDWTSYTVKAEISSDAWIAAVSTHPAVGEMYWGALCTYSGSITQKAGEITITGNPSKVYDGQEIVDPAVNAESDARMEDLVYQYYKVNSDGSTTYLGDGVRPKDAGTYIVTASIPATGLYTADTSQPLEFTIARRPVIMELTAEGNGSDATVQVTVYGMIDDETDAASVLLQVNGGNGETIPLTEDDGMYTASKTFTSIPENEYQVKATYQGSENYICTPNPIEETFSKVMADRTLLLSNNRISITYGEETVMQLTATPEAVNGGSDQGSNDVYSFEVLYDEYVTGHSPAGKSTISITDVGKRADGTGAATIHFDNAGKAVIKVTVKDTADSKACGDAVAYAVVEISERDLTVSSYAYKTNDSGDEEEIAEFVYGGIDNSVVRYGLKYAGLADGDTEDTVAAGILRPLPLAETTAAGQAKIRIAKLAYSRNYDIKPEPGTVTIKPAVLVIQVDDAESAYGVEPEYSYTVGDGNGNFGLKAWDIPEKTISVGTESPYTEYAPQESAYPDVITAEVGANYVLTDGGVSTLAPGDLTVHKGAVSLNADVPSKVYDKQPVNIVTDAVPVTSNGITAEELQPIGTVTVKYFEIVDGARKAMRAAPKDAGHYLAVITVPGNEYYEKSSAAVLFNIRKARSNEPAPQVPDLKMQPGLTLADQWLPEGWTWVDPVRTLEPGYVTAYAVYRPPGDEKNYYPEVRTIGFEVYMESAGDPDAPGGNTGDNAGNGGSGVGTGDNSHPLLWAGAMLLAISLALVLSRRRDRRKW